jgi:glucans biosynthesis protein C
MRAAHLGFEPLRFPRMNSTQQRWHSLDALRAFALLLGVVFHSALSYVLPPGIWAVGTAKPSVFLGWFTYYAHSFRMELFFLLAGFFTAMVIDRRGVAAFIRDRVRRILLVFFLWLYPMKFALGALWVIGGRHTGWLKLPPEVASLPWWQLVLGGLSLESWSNFQLTQLWFLYYLGCVSSLFLAARWLLGRLPRPGTFHRPVREGFRRIMSSRLAPLIVATVVTPSLAMMKGPDVETPDQSLSWNLPVMALYGFFFSSAGASIGKTSCLMYSRSVGKSF